MDADWDTPGVLNAVYERGLAAMDARECASLLAAFNEFEPSKLVRERGEAMLAILGRAGELGLAGLLAAGERVAAALEKALGEKTQPHNTPPVAAAEKWRALADEWRKYFGAKETAEKLRAARDVLLEREPPERLRVMQAERIAVTAKHIGAHIAKGAEAGDIFAAAARAFAEMRGIVEPEAAERTVLSRLSVTLSCKVLERASDGAESFSDPAAALALIRDSLATLPVPARDAMLSDLGPASLDAAGLWNMFKSGVLRNSAEAGARGALVAAGVVNAAVVAATVGDSFPLMTYAGTAVLSALVLNPATALLLAAGLGAFLYRRAERELSAALLETAIFRIIHAAALAPRE